MKAAILAVQRQPLLIDDVELPKELLPGQVLVKVKASGICGSQVALIDGETGRDPYLPHLLGHEGSGIIKDVGPGVLTVSKGDHVVMHCGVGSGIESATPVYKWKGAHLNAGRVTTFNEKAVVSENRVTTIPRDFDLNLAPLFGCAVLTGLGAISKAGVQLGDSVVVFGVGGVGLTVVQGAAMVSAHPIIAVDLREDKLSIAREMGATHCIEAGTEEPEVGIRRVVGDVGVDVAFECSGQADNFELLSKVTRTDGKTVLLSGPRAGQKLQIDPMPLHFGRTLMGYQVITESKPHEEIPRYINLVNAKKLNLRELVTEHCRLVEINSVIDDLRHGRVTGRCVIEF